MLDATGQSLMQSAMNQMQLSTRGYHRVLTIGTHDAQHDVVDLAGSESIQPSFWLKRCKTGQNEGSFSAGIIRWFPFSDEEGSRRTGDRMQSGCSQAGPAW
jgi:hypothetical protein